MPILSTKQLAAVLRVRPQTLRRDRCRNKPEIPYFKTPAGHIFYDSDVVKAWLRDQLTSGVAK